MKHRRGHKIGYLATVFLGTAISAAPAPASTDAAVSDLSRYCNSCWRNAGVQADRWSDCTQEVFVRMLERTKPEKWDGLLGRESPERQEFLRAIDTVKKRAQRTRRYAALAADVADEIETDRYEDKRMVMEAAASKLSARQRQILAKSFDGWTVGEIAAQTRMSSARVSDEKYKGIRKLRDCFANLKPGF